MTAGAFESALPCPQHSLTTLSAFEERNVRTRQNTFLFTKNNPKTEGGVTDTLNRSKNYIRRTNFSATFDFSPFF